MTREHVIGGFTPDPIEIDAILSGSGDIADELDDKINWILSPVNTEVHDEPT